MIRLAQRLGSILRDIADLTNGLQNAQMSVEEVSALLRSKIANLQAKAAEIMSLRDILHPGLDDVCPLGLTATA